MNNRKKISADEKGNILMLFSLMLPILTALFILVIDTGNAYLAKAELNKLASSAAEYGMTLVSDTIIQLAEAHCAPNCLGEPSDYLTDADLLHLASQGFENEIINQTQAMLANMLAETATIAVSQVAYDANIASQPLEITTSVKLITTPEGIFTKVFDIADKPVDYTGQAKILLHTS